MDKGVALLIIFLLPFCLLGNRYAEIIDTFARCLKNVC